MRTEVLIRNQQRAPADRRRLIAVIKKSLLVERFDKPAEVSIVLVDDAEMRILNHKYRGIDRSTDVLSFSQLEGERPEAKGMPVVLGDIIISVETAIRQAESRGVLPDSELDLLAVHGLLHLLGYNDETDAQADEMRERESAILGSMESV